MLLDIYRSRGTPPPRPVQTCFVKDPPSPRLVPICSLSGCAHEEITVNFRFQDWLYASIRRPSEDTLMIDMFIERVNYSGILFCIMEKFSCYHICILLLCKDYFQCGAVLSIALCSGPFDMCNITSINLQISVPITIYCLNVDSSTSNIYVVVIALN